MARQPFNDPEIIQIRQERKMNKVNPEREAELMIRYTETTTRELFFAIDLMDFVLSLSDLQLPDCAHRNCCERIGQSDLDDQIKRFIELYIAYKTTKIRNTRIMKEMDRVNYEQFKWFVNNVANKTDAKLQGEEALRHGTQSYWKFCIRIAQLCTTAYQHGKPDAPHFGIMLMCRTFSNFDRKSAFHSVHPWTWIKHIAYESYSKLELKALGMSRSLKRISSFQ